MRCLSTRCVWPELRWTKRSRVTGVRLTDTGWVTLIHPRFAILGIEAVPDLSNVEGHRCVGGNSRGIESQPFGSLDEIATRLRHKLGEPIRERGTPGSPRENTDNFSGGKCPVRDAEAIISAGENTSDRCGSLPKHGSTRHADRRRRCWLPANPH